MLIMGLRINNVLLKAYESNLVELVRNRQIIIQQKITDVVYTDLVRLFLVNYYPIILQKCVDLSLQQVQHFTRFLVSFYLQFIAQVVHYGANLIIVVYVGFVLQYVKV